jgi:hypothetical protein
MNLNFSGIIQHLGIFRNFIRISEIFRSSYDLLGSFTNFQEFEGIEKINY